MTEVQHQASTPLPHDILAALDPDSYTVNRLAQATPEHLDITTRRYFIGPIPIGWLKEHRRDWYKHHLGIHYSSRAASFSTGPTVGRRSSLTGPNQSTKGKSPTRISSTLARYRQEVSFPQPEDLDATADINHDVEESNADEHDGESVNVSLHTQSISSSSAPDFEVVSSDQAPELERFDTADEFMPVAQASTQITTAGPRNAGALSKVTQRTTGTSFSTAEERFQSELHSVTPAVDYSANVEANVIENDQDPGNAPSNHRPSTVGSGTPQFAAEQSSTVALLHHSRAPDLTTPLQDLSIKGQDVFDNLKNQFSQEIVDLNAHEAAEAVENALEDASPVDVAPKKENLPGPVRFDLSNNDVRQEGHVRERIAQMKASGWNKLRRTKHNVQEGEIVKMEQMLIRAEFTSHELPNDFDENESQKIESRTVGKWKEYMVVCRETEDNELEYVLQLYKTRVIPAIEKPQAGKHSANTIFLSRKKQTRVNLYSSLDKTVVLWHPCRRGTLIYIMQPQSGAHAMEWYTFLRNVMNWPRTGALQVYVPKLDVSLRLNDPFRRLERIPAGVSDVLNTEAISTATTTSEQYAAADNIIKRCMDMLARSPEFHDLVSHLENTGEKVGLAWKRYDRLEWVHGTNEHRMYGTIGMEKSHELELRLKEHYPTTVKDSAEEILTEPAPVEGFLIRLTSHRGIDQRFGRLYYKRLYFSTHNQFLIYNLPARSNPPAPPRLPTQEGTIPSASQIAEMMPLMYAVTPYSMRDGFIEWLHPDEPISPQRRALHDKDAHDEDERTTGLLYRCDGCLDLCDVVRVRRLRRGATPADNNIGPGSGSDVDFDQEVDDTHRDDGVTTSLDDERTFELVLRNGIVIRLQAYNKTTSREWMSRLRALTTYWTLRTAADQALYKFVRRENLARLKIDEDTEAFMGQFARKWEVTNSYASSTLYNVCGISNCRPVIISGMLYRKGRMHAKFEKNLVMLVAGRLLVFRDALRSTSGKELPGAHHERLDRDCIDLSGCYIYSGLVTENDLLRRDIGQNLSRGTPGRRALPRMWIEDGWSSIDEDVMTCFVVWHGLRKSLFRSDQGKRGMLNKKLKFVSQLGVEGRSIVFKTRSRAERDHWVMAIAMEIERVSESGGDVRLVKKLQGA